MIINKLTADQITANWETIKYAYINSGMFSNIESSCKGLLLNLLSEKFQCWAGVSESTNQIVGIVITSVQQDVGGYKYLLINCVYAYSASSIEDKEYIIKGLRELAKNLACKSIIFYTNNESIINIINKFGFTETHKVFMFNIGG